MTQLHTEEVGIGTPAQRDGKHASPDYLTDDEKIIRRLSFHRDNSPLAVIEWDDELRVTYWSASAARMFGWTANDVMGKFPTEWPFIYEEDTHDVRDVIARLLSLREDNVSRNRNYTSKGNLLWCEWHNSVLKDGEGQIVCIQSVVQDITEQRDLELQLRQKLAVIEEQKAKLVEANKAIAEAYVDLAEANTRLETLATTDGLTGLKNHRTFQEQLGMEYQRTRRHQAALSLLMLDVDHFKQYNDRFGHPSGDQILKRVADILQQTARTTDFVGRYGGEEFVMLLPQTDVSGAMEAAERAREQVAAQSWGPFPITVSVGVASWQPDQMAAESSLVGVDAWQAETFTPGTLLEQADRALYDAKAAGRNCVRCYGEPVHP